MILKDVILGESVNNTCLACAFFWGNIFFIKSLEADMLAAEACLRCNISISKANPNE